MANAAHTPSAAPFGAPVREIACGQDGWSIAEVSKSLEPVILRGFVSHWPAVAAAKQSDDALYDYLCGFNRDAAVPVSVGPASIDGRIFYNDDFSGLNADRGNARMGEVLRRIHAHGKEARPPLIYLASADINECLPGFLGENDLDFGAADPLPSIWIGTRTRISAHNDLPLNIACVVAGRRRFTLFPPDQTPNLYVGPFELTPAGRPISLVDFAAPDFDKFPRFAEAMKTARVADLEPGDALFLPSMWWHHVEASGSFNVLVNYWWRTVPSFLGTPQDVLNHAMMTLRDLPPEERKIWRDLFDHYVFSSDDQTAAHIPEQARGILAPMTSDIAQRVRKFLLNRLNR